MLLVPILAAAEPLSTESLASRLPSGVVVVVADPDTQAILSGEMRGGSLPRREIVVNPAPTCGMLVAVAGSGWMAVDLGPCPVEVVGEEAIAEADEGFVRVVDPESLRKYEQQRLIVRYGSEIRPGVTWGPAGPMPSSSYEDFWYVQQGSVRLKRREWKELLGDEATTMEKARDRATVWNAELRSRLSLSTSDTRAIDNAPLPPQ